MGPFNKHKNQSPDNLGNYPSSDDSDNEKKALEQSIFEGLNPELMTNDERKKLLQSSLVKNNAYKQQVNFCQLNKSQYQHLNRTGDFMTKHTTYSKQEKQIFKDLCRVLINSKIDCRRFINIKLIFLEHENLKDGKLPLDDFKDLLNKKMKRETLTDYVEQ